MYLEKDTFLTLPFTFWVTSLHSIPSSVQLLVHCSASPGRLVLSFLTPSSSYSPTPLSLSLSLSLSLAPSLSLSPHLVSPVPDFFFLPS